MVDYAQGVAPRRERARDALDLLDVLLTEIFSKAEDLGRKARLRTLKDLKVGEPSRRHP